MENDQRLTPLPITKDLQPVNIEYPGNYSSSYDNALDSRRSIRQYFNIVYKRLPIILAITILTTAAAAFYSFRQPSIYEAQASMIIEPRKVPQTQKDAININFGDNQQYYNTQLELLKNPDLMRRVVISLGLHRDPNLFGEQNRGILASVRSLFSGGQKTESTDNSLPIVSDTSPDTAKNGQIQLTPEENTRAEFYAAVLVSGLRVVPLDRTNIVNISLQSTNPSVAAKAADRVAELFIKEDADRETSGAQKAYEDLGASIEELKGTIAQQENDMIAEMKSGNLPLVEGGNALRADNLKILQAQRNDAQLEVDRLQAMYNAAVQAGENGDILSIVGDNQAIIAARKLNDSRKIDLEKRIEDLDRRIDERQQKREELLVKYTTEHKSVKQIDAEIVTLNSQRERVGREGLQKITIEGSNFEKNAVREVLASLRSQLAASQQRLSGAIAKFDQQAAKANIEGQVETKLTTLRDGLKNNRDLLNTYTQRQKEQELALSSGRPDNITVQNKAMTPGSPIGPQRGRNILVALLLSFAAGIGLAFLLDYLDDSVRTSDDISRHLGLPTLALIPHYLNTEKRKLLTAVNGNGAAAPSALITMDDRHSPMAEAYRHLRTSLLFSSAGKPPQTILVTSSQPSEGKTTTAINTAITLAQSDADVVIIDCDLRRPRLHSHFGFENTKGLTNYLSGDKDTENLIRTYADLPRLKIITSGPIPPNPAELLSSNEMRNLLEFLSGKFKHVIIDSPPAISFTDASILSTLVDGVILVAMANKSSIHLMRQFKQRVSAIGARIYGVVLNGIKAGSMEYDYYGSGYYKYYSQSDDDESTPYLEDQERANAEAAGK
ncbi:MAG: polysaccharide biosynthesis tyrosine autokinase [Chloracidobacterium sp.]|nr:polysaccharide biosynthesis tyrosine autokinase [Chloracidobacterium sp.]